MHCASCAAIIENALKKEGGIKSANVNFASEKLYLEYDPTVISLEKIKNLVDKLGHQIEEEGGDEEGDGIRAVGDERLAQNRRTSHGRSGWFPGRPSFFLELSGATAENPCMTSTRDKILDLLDDEREHSRGEVLDLADDAGEVLSSMIDAKEIVETAGRNLLISQ